MSDKRREIDRNLMGERIRRLREEQGLSRDDFAKLLGITERHLAGIETGNKGLSMRIFYHIKKELDSSADYILEGSASYPTDDEKKSFLLENIVSYLSACTVKQLECMESIVKSYVRSHVDKDE